MTTRTIQVKLETTTDGRLRAVLADTSKDATGAAAAVDTLNQALREKETADKTSATSAATSTRATVEQGAAAKTAKGEIDSVTQSIVKRADADTAAAASMRRADQAIVSGAASVRRMTMSTREMEAAMRMLPAQMTDISVGLATGQSPFYILLQQGGQLKDMFGGIGPALRAVGSWVMNLVNPFTLAAAAAGGVAAAVYEIYKSVRDNNAELKLFDEALNTTGRYASRTSAEILLMADRLGKPKDDAKQFRDILQQLIATGQFAGPSLGNVAKGIRDIQTATGMTAKAIIADYQRIFKDPAGAAADLTQQMHFLSAAQFAQVQSLQAMGEKGRAADIVLNAMKDSMTAGASQADALADKLAKVVRQMDDIKNHPANFNFGGGMYGLPTIPAGQDPQYKKLHDQADQISMQMYIRDQFRAQESGWKADAAATIQAQQALSRYLSPLTKYRDTLKQIKSYRNTIQADPTLSKETKDKYGAALDNWAKQARKTYQSQTGLTDSAQLTADVRAYSQALHRIETDYANHNKVLGSERRAGLLDETAYYQKRVALIDKHEKAQTDAMDKELADLRSRKASGAEQIRLNQQIADIENKRRQATAAANAARKQADNDHLRALQQEQRAVAAYGAALAQSLSTRQQSIDDQVAAVGMGSQEATYRQRLNAVHREVDSKSGRLTLQRNAHQIGDQQYQDELQKLHAYEDQRVHMEQDGYRRLQLAQGDWKNGAIAALEDFRDQSNDIAGQTYQGLSTMFGDLNTDLINFAHTGKISFANVAQDFGDMLLKMELQRAESNVGNWLLNAIGTAAGAYTGAAMSGSSWTGGSSLTGGTYVGAGSMSTTWPGAHASGGPIHGPGTTTSDSILMRASRGEYVIRAAAVQHYGQAAMDAINHMTAPGFATGGPVGGAPSAGGTGRGNVYVTVEDHSGGAQPKIQRSSDNQGNEFIRVIIEQAVNEVDSRILRGGSTYHALQGKFGLSAVGHPVGV